MRDLFGSTKYIKFGVLETILSSSNAVNDLLELEEQKKLEQKALKEAKRLEEKNKPKLTKEEKIKLKKEEKLKKAEERKKQHAKLNDVYINENVKLNKPSLGKRIIDNLNDINHLPDKIAASFRKSWNNLTFVKNSKNRRDINRQALLINFEGADAEKSDKKLVYEYGDDYEVEHEIYFTPFYELARMLG